MSGISFHPVSNGDDIAAVAALAREIWSEHYAGLLDPDQIEYMLRTMQSPGPIGEQIENGYTYELVTRDGRPVGYIAYRLNDPPGQMFVSKIYLRHEERGRGYLRKILARLDEEARAGGLTSMWLTVNRGNSSVAPYRAVGFETVREQDVDIGGGYEMNDFVMERIVSPAEQKGT